MSKKKIGVIAGALAAIIAIAVAAYFYAQGDHSGPSVTVASDFQANYGQRIGLFDLVTAISDQSEYTVAITKGGQIAEDGRSTVFATAGNEEVEITAEDEYGHKTVKTVAVQVLDAKPPMISAKDITISVGDAIDYHTGVTAEDEMDGNLTSQIQVDTSQVDETRAGIYPVIYTVSDSSGNQAMVRVALTIQNPEAQEITLSQQTLSLEGNGHYQLAATVEPRAWTGRLQWSSSDESVAVVSDGLISWVGIGSCVITAQADDVTAQCQVTCGYVSVTSAKLDQIMLTLEYQETQTLSLKVVPSNWSGNVVWTSSDTTVATVDNGKVTWAGQGECVITASADGRTASCTVTCNEPVIESLEIEEEEINLSADGTYVIVPTILPEDWPGEIAWRSSDPSVATVENGQIRWIGAGTCTITATAGELTDSCTVICAERSTIGDLIDDLLGGGGHDDTNHDNEHFDQQGSQNNNTDDED